MNEIERPEVDSATDRKGVANRVSGAILGLIAMWRIQSQLVSDIASVYGKTANLGKEHMLWCLFKHSAAQAFTDVAFRAGERYLIRKSCRKIPAVGRCCRSCGLCLFRHQKGGGGRDRYLWQGTFFPG